MLPAPVNPTYPLRGFGSFSLHQNHLAMRNAGFGENRTDTAKTHLFVESDHRHLRMRFVRELEQSGAIDQIYSQSR